MSERLKHSGEQHEAPKHSNEQQEALQKSLEKEAKNATHEHAENLDKIRSEVESQAKTKEASEKHAHGHNKEKEKPVFINRELKSMAYQRTLRRTRQQLPTLARPFSSLIHQPGVEAVSDFAGKTVARPSGVLMGGITAFVGSSIFLWAAKHYGYEYNFLLFALFFVGGFFAGLLLELVIHLVQRKSK